MHTYYYVQGPGNARVDQVDVGSASEQLTGTSHWSQGRRGVLWSSLGTDSAQGPETHVL